MYQVSERVKKQFEYTMSIPCVKEAMKFIQEDERNTIEEQKELVLCRFLFEGQQHFHRGQCEHFQGQEL